MNSTKPIFSFFRSKFSRFLVICSLFFILNWISQSVAYTATTISFATAVKYPVGSSPSMVVPVDVNKDGIVDLVTANTISNNVSVLLGNGNGTFQAATNFSVGSTTPIGLAVADLNGDSNPDLVTVNVTTNSVSILLGNGTGAFGTATIFPTGSLPYAVGIADFNADGNRDLVTANSSGNSISLLLGNGNGAFGAPTSFAVGNNPQALVVGDFNVDTRPDVATANYNSNNVSVLLANGSGGFNPATNYVVNTNPDKVIILDFNGDGKLDLASSNFGASSTSLLLGDNTGSFVNKASFISSQNALAAGDFNLDDKIDLVTSNLNNTSLSILPNNGAVGVGATVTTSAGATPYDVAVADFNADGKPDIVTANNSSNNVSILLNTTAPPTAKISTYSGTPQSTTVITLYSNPLQVKVTDQSNTPLNGVSVSFKAPTNPGLPGGSFAGPSQTANATTGPDGVATAPAFTANCVTGNFQVSADVNGAATPAFFSLTNIVSNPSNIAAVSGTSQSAVYNTTFPTAFKVIVRDSCFNPVSGYSVLFSAPTNGAGGTFTGNNATAIIQTDANGFAIAPTFTANDTLGSYSVTAKVVGFNNAGVANFNLTNIAGPLNSISAVSGTTPQSTVVNTPFGITLSVILKDVDGHPINGSSVSFAAPNSLATGNFSVGGLTTTVTTNVLGIATAPTFTASCRAGNYNVTASVAGFNGTATFNLTNTVGSPNSLVPIGGFGQRTLINTVFATNLKAAVKDSCGNGLSGITVIFNASNSGASGSFPGNSNTASVVTDSNGIAIAPALTANATTGSYSVTASAVGYSMANISFNLTNLPSDYGDFAPSTYQTNPSLNGSVTMPGFLPPLRTKWTAQFDGYYGYVSYALAAQHKIFVLSSTPNINYGARLSAVDPATGQTLWGPVNIAFTYYWAAMAYDNGRIFVLDNNGKLSAFEAADGSFVWSTNAPGGYSAYDYSPPVAVNGLIFTRISSNLRVFKASDGSMVWSKTIPSSDYIFMHGSSVFVGDDGVYLAGSCQKAFKFQIFDGNPIWNYDSGCAYEGQEGTLYNNRIYVRAGSNPPGLILDAVNGTYLGNWIPTGALPTFSGNTAFIVNSNGKLEARDATTGALLWTKSLLNASFRDAPIVINNIVYIVDDQGNIYGYDPTGALKWQGFTGSLNGIGDLRLISGLGAGENLLLVPTGNTLVALESVSNTAVAGYQSNPSPGSTLNVGSTRLSTTATTSITVSETGSANLAVSNPVISGANGSEFALSGISFPFYIADGGSPKSFNVTCTPTKGGLRTATLTLTTSDPANPTVSYNLTCTGTLVVTESTDDGTGTTPGTLSYYLYGQRAESGQTITFALTGPQQVNVTGKLPRIPTGVKVDGGSCGNNGPSVALDGYQIVAPNDGLVLEGQNTIKNLLIKRFPGRQLVTNGTGNSVSCVQTQK